MFNGFFFGLKLTFRMSISPIHSTYEKCKRSECSTFISQSIEYYGIFAYCNLAKYLRLWTE